MRPEIERVRQAYQEAAENAMNVMAEDLAGRAVNDAPIQDGFLRGSVSPGGNPAFGGSPDATVRRIGSRIEVDVTFSAVYAAAQHEGHAIMHRKVTGTDEKGGKYSMLVTYEWRARNWPGGGGPKYLEKNLFAMAPRYEAVLKAELDKVIAGG